AGSAARSWAARVPPAVRPGGAAPRGASWVVTAAAAAQGAPAEPAERAAGTRRAAVAARGFDPVGRERPQQCRLRGPTAAPTPTTVQFSDFDPYEHSLTPTDTPTQLTV